MFEFQHFSTVQNLSTILNLLQNANELLQHSFFLFLEFGKHFSFIIVYFYKAHYAGSRKSRKKKHTFVIKSNQKEQCVSNHFEMIT